MKKLLIISLSIVCFFSLKSSNYNQKMYEENIPKNIECIIGADIGGTNSDFGVFYKTPEKIRLILSIHLKSKDITNFSDTIKSILEYLKNKYQITIKYASFAAAGVVSESRNFCKITNTDFYIDTREIIEKQTLKMLSLLMILK